LADNWDDVLRLIDEHKNSIHELNNMGNLDDLSVDNSIRSDVFVVDEKMSGGTAAVQIPDFQDDDQCKYTYDGNISFVEIRNIRFSHLSIALSESHMNNSLKMHKFNEENYFVSGFLGREKNISTEPGTCRKTDYMPFIEIIKITGEENNNIPCYVALNNRRLYLIMSLICTKFSETGACSNAEISFKKISEFIDGLIGTKKVYVPCAVYDYDSEEARVMCKKLDNPNGVKYYLDNSKPTKQNIDYCRNGLEARAKGTSGVVVDEVSEYPGGFYSGWDAIAVNRGNEAVPQGMSGLEVSVREIVEHPRYDQLKNTNNLKINLEFKGKSFDQNPVTQIKTYSSCQEGFANYINAINIQFRKFPHQETEFTISLCEEDGSIKSISEINLTRKFRCPNYKTLYDVLFIFTVLHFFYTTMTSTGIELLLTADNRSISIVKNILDNQAVDYPLYLTLKVILDKIIDQVTFDQAMIYDDVEKFLTTRNSKSVMQTEKKSSSLKPSKSKPPRLIPRLLRTGEDEYTEEKKYTEEEEYGGRKTVKYKKFKRRNTRKRN
jgi:hypothetical protein